MILSEYIEIKWHATNKKYFIDNGYIFTKIGDKFSVKINDLKKGSHVLIHVKCDICGNEKYISYKRYNKNIKSGEYYACSNKCAMNKNNITNLKKYGTTNPNNLNEFKERAKQTCLKKYGVDCTLQAEGIKNKVIETTIKNFGTNHHTQSLNFKERVKKNNLKKYGVESFLTTDEFKNKRKQTNLKKYGTENPAQSNFVKKKMKITNLKRYGLEYAIQSNYVREKIKQTNLEKYGYEYSHQNKEVSQKATNSMIEKYGEVWVNHAPKYNVNSIIYLDILSKKLNLPIQHALNGGEKKFVRYWVDGYIPEHNICIEWDEIFHKLKKFKERDLKREIFLKENFNCHIIRIIEKEFLKDIDNQIFNVINLINTTIKEKHGKPI
jgi:hypothetical protein